MGRNLGNEGWNRETWAAQEGAAGSREITPGCGQWELHYKTAFRTEWEFCQKADLYPVLVLPQIQALNIVVPIILVKKKT